jgi:hypothetical protein
MTGIIEFVEACLNEDEAAAVRAARPEPWTMPQPSRSDWYVQFWADPEDRAAVIADPESSAYPVVASLVGDDEDLAEGRVDHIARWDPTRVLTEVAAKRKLIDFAFAYASEVDDERGDGHTAEQIRAGECADHGGQAYIDVLRLLALPYADHPDYDENWRPSPSI